MLQLLRNYCRTNMNLDTTDLHSEVIVIAQINSRLNGGCAVSDPVWVESKWLLAFPRVLVIPGIPFIRTIFSPCCPLNDQRRAALGRFLVFLSSLRLSIVSGISFFLTNLFRLAAAPFALLVKLNLSFLTGTLEWFFKITKVVSFESFEAPQEFVLDAILFSLFINDFPAFLPSSVSHFLYADDLAIWALSSAAVEATQEPLRL